MNLPSLLAVCITSKSYIFKLLLFLILYQELLVMTSRRSTMRKQYSPQAITEGMELFHSGYSIRGAAKVVGVPEATLRKKLKECE